MASTVVRKFSRLVTRNLGHDYFHISPEVRSAINERRPVVALESTIYTHGFPSPENLSLALELESIVRANGAVPATIGIIDGIAKVGLTKLDLTRLTDPEYGSTTLKVSCRDLPFVLGSTTCDGTKYSGGTTVAATMRMAHAADIAIFATGGLGGVHRGVENTMDISADLTELGKNPTAVISSGCKSFLDIPRTLEYLETQGVLVSTFAQPGQSHVPFPAFWSRDSGFKSPSIVTSSAQAASIIRTSKH